MGFNNHSFKRCSCAFCCACCCMLLCVKKERNINGTWERPQLVNTTIKKLPS